MADVAAHGGGQCVSLKSCAARQGVSVKYLEQIAPHLLRAGLLTSVRGVRGGYTLASPPEHVTAGDILRAIPQAATLYAAPAAGGGVQAFSAALLAAAYAYADSVTLRDLVSAPADDKRRAQVAYLLD